MLDTDLEADLKRYPRRPFLKEQSIWAIWVYRWGKRIDQYESKTRKAVETKIYWLAFRIVETITGISLPKGAEILAGLKVWHFGNVFVSAGVKIGRNCTLRQGVTIGNRHEGGPLPEIGDNVEFGAYSQVLGGVRIMDNVKIAAMSVVLIDVPAYATVAGIPAKIVKISSPHTHL